MNTRSDRPPIADPDLRRSWLFVGGTPTAAVLDATLACGADVVIVDLEPKRLGRPRQLQPSSAAYKIPLSS